jgi:hypothetical protein
MGVSEVVILLPILCYWAWIKVEPEMAHRLMALRPPPLTVEGTSKEGGEPPGPVRTGTAGTMPVRMGTAGTMPVRMGTAGTIPTIHEETAFEVKALPASNSKLRQVFGRRNGTAHLDAV